MNRGRAKSGKSHELKRELRVHQQNQARKQKRDDSIAKRRNLDDIKQSVIDEKHKTKESRLEQLAKWKAEKELKKKLEKKIADRKKAFVTGKSTAGSATFNKPCSLPPVPGQTNKRSTRLAASTNQLKSKNDVNKSQQSNKVTRSSTIASEKKPNEDTRKSTRQAASTNQLKSKNDVNKPQQRNKVTRSSTNASEKPSEATRKSTRQGSNLMNLKSSKPKPSNVSKKDQPNNRTKLGASAAEKSVKSSSCTKKTTKVVSKKTDTDQDKIEDLTSKSDQVHLNECEGKEETGNDSEQEAMDEAENCPSVTNAESGKAASSGKMSNEDNSLTEKETNIMPGNKERDLQVSKPDKSEGKENKTDFLSPIPNRALLIGKRSSMSEEKPPRSVYDSPGMQFERPRRKTYTPGSYALSQKRKKDYRKSSALRGLTAEEAVAVLAQSPMIEMTRRRRKPAASPANELEMSNLSETCQLIEEVKAEGLDPVLPDPEDDEACQALETSIMEVIECRKNHLPSPVNPFHPSKSLLNETATEMQVDSRLAIPQFPSLDDCADALPVVSANVTGKTSASAGNEEEVPTTDMPTGSDEHDVPYFRNLLASNTERLTKLSEKWDEICSSTPSLSEEVQGQLRTVVGQARLLMRQRFKQFSGLIDNCEFHLGEKETTCMDLQGFWDLIYFQVEDVEIKFKDLDALKDRNWQQEEKLIVKKKVIKKKKPVTKPGKPGAAKSRFAEFRAKMKAQATEKTAELEIMVSTKEKQEASPAASAATDMKSFDGGFFAVNSPVSSPKHHCEVGSSPNLPKPSLGRRSSSRPSSRPGSRPGSRHTTPASSPLLLHLVNQIARRSLITPSPLMNETPPTSSSLQAPSIFTPNTRITRRSLIRPSPIMNETPQTNSSLQAPSIFTPNEPTPVLRRSTRRSVQFMASPMPAHQTKEGHPPVTPYNRSSLVACERKTSTRRSHLLFTPPSDQESDDPIDSNIDLMAFSPAVGDSKICGLTPKKG